MGNKWTSARARGKKRAPEENERGSRTLPTRKPVTKQIRAGRMRNEEFTAGKFTPRNCVTRRRMTREGEGREGGRELTGEITARGKNA